MEKSERERRHIEKGRERGKTEEKETGRKKDGEKERAMREK